MTESPPRHILIFEPDERGHAREWFEHLTNFAAERHPDVKVTLAVPRSLASALDIPSSIGIETLTVEEEGKSLHHKLAVSGMGRWNAMQNISRRAARITAFSSASTTSPCRWRSACVVAGPFQAFSSDRPRIMTIPPRQGRAFPNASAIFARNFSMR